ncbi:MAG TPA: PP2C family protein-serine/threonine phosphatase [Bryobacteraceae bacterium]|jgi:sigma-B regulation protein RsbU (phosphoserine phosphatase)|nr:PP2C family protein-serine/threonine phosphatase [Bryobacteraceae bacterium]
MTACDLVVDVSEDWVLACAVQQRFMHGPGRNTGAVDYSGRCRQVRALGGDCYDFMPLPDDRLSFVVGDASGKGLAAALMIASVQSSLRTAALFTGNDLAELLKIVNLQAYASSLDDRYATVFYGVFDRAARTLRHVNAGHNPPAVLRNNGSVHWLEPGGPPVGMFPDSNYRESVFQLQPGDLVVAYTDGVTEATDPGCEEWGVEGLLKAVAAWEPQSSQGAEDLVQSIFNSMHDFSRGCQTDDATRISPARGLTMSR